MLIFNDANWNVSGLFVYDGVVRSFIESLGILGTKNPIKGVHGAPRVKWNGGRVSRTPANISTVQILTTVLNDIDVSVFMTFSNHLLGKDDIKDPFCNQMLDVLEYAENGVIVSSEMLATHIRTHHPNLKQIASVVKTTIEKGTGNVDYYKRLLDNYDRVVIHPDDNLNLELLDKLDKSRCEILVNENCLINCSTRGQHYDILARASMQSEMMIDFKFQEECGHFHSEVCKSYPLRKRLLQPNIRNCNLTHVEMKTIYDMGFRNFKLQGRNESQASFSFDLNWYILKPEMMPIVFKAMA